MRRCSSSWPRSVYAEKPVIAAVNGAAVGIGTTMLLHCDLVYCADNAMFSMPFVSLGLCSEFASSLLVPMNAGYHKAAEKLLLGEPMSAEEAAEMKIVNRILPPGRGARLRQETGRALQRPAADLGARNQAPDEGRRSRR